MTTETALKIRLNGASRSVDPGATVADVLRTMDLDPSSPKGIAVAVNDAVVPKNEWHERTLAQNDRVEVITARQGG